MMYLDRIKSFMSLKRGSHFLLLFCIVLFSCSDSIQEYHISGQTMGTVYNIKMITKSIDDQLLSKIQTSIDSALLRVNQQMSNYIPRSETSQFNVFNDTSKFKISNELYTVIEEALQINKISNGAFDITVNPLVNLWGFGSNKSQRIIPTDPQIQSVLSMIGSAHIQLIDHQFIKKDIPEVEIDLGAIAKGYGVDVVADVLNGFNQTNYMVEIGGEVYVKGKNFLNKNWKIGIDKPKYLALPGKELQDTLSISNVGVATSGDYRNYFEVDGKIYSHTINPKTGKPVTHNLASVSIIAPTCMMADALATAVLVLGKEEGLKLLETLPEVEGYLLTRISTNEFEEIKTSGFSRYLD